MKYCPNRDCRYARKYNEGQEYRDEALTCADCGAELTPVRPVWPAEVTSRPTPLWIRIALTVVTPIVVLCLPPQVPLPRIDWRQLGAFGVSDRLSVFALGLRPLFSAFVLVAYSAGYVLGLGVLGLLLSEKWSLYFYTLVPVVVVVAVALDVIAEAKAVRRHGELVPVWPEHRLYAFESARALLERSGIPSLARSVHHRVLWQFLAPWVPIQIMVPASRAEEAARLLQEHFLGEAAPGTR